MLSHIYMNVLINYTASCYLLHKSLIKYFFNRLIKTINLLIKFIKCIKVYIRNHNFKQINYTWCKTVHMFINKNVILMHNIIVNIKQ